MKTQTQQFKKTIMWYKVTELNSKGFNKSQISKAVGIDRSTVRKYLSMVEVDFIAWISNPKPSSQEVAKLCSLHQKDT